MTSLPKQNNIQMSHASTVLSSNRPRMTVNPAFVLPGIDPWAIRENYHKGAFRLLKLPLGRKENLPLVNSAIQAPIGTTAMDDSFSIKLKNNAMQTIVTTNTCFFNMFTHEQRPIPIGGICHWCRFPYEEHSICIPIQKKQIPKEGPVGSTELPLEQFGYNIYFGEGLFCNPQCALAALNNYRNIGSIFRSNYQYSESYLGEIFTMLQISKGIAEPKHLKAAPDFRLSKAMGGPLEKEDFHKGSSVYIPIPGVVLAPAKLEFIRTVPGALNP